MTTHLWSNCLKLSEAKALASKQELADLSDVELIHDIARGDELAFDRLYERYGSILFGLLLRILNTRTEAEDVLQEVFLQVWQRAASFDETRGRPFTWLVTLARSRAIDRLRSLDTRGRVETEVVQQHHHGASESPDDPADNAATAEQSATVHHALSKIPAEQRHTLLLAYFEGLTQSEIAERLGEPLGTVKTRTRSGLMKLRELLRNKMTVWF